MANHANGWQFKRGLDDNFMEQLEPLATQPGWFADVLADHDLILGVRDNYLNVYGQGQSVFKIERNGRVGPLRFSTHPKYLVDPNLARPVTFTGSAFEINSLRPLAAVYEGPVTLARMKRAAQLYSLKEKQGVQDIARANPNVIDTEIAFSREMELDKSPYVPRIDLACLRDVNGSIRLRFWEAKLYGNSEIRASGDTLPPVVKQVEGYRELVEKHREEILQRYRLVACNLVQIACWAGAISRIGQVVQRVAAGEDIRMDTPSVGLAVFGFDRAQKVNERWRTEINKLSANAGIAICCAGDPKNIKLRGN